MNAFKIFVVEDDPLYSEMLKYHLSLNPDNEVIKFETGEECLKNLHKSPSLISLDYSLPDMSGFDVIKKVKEYNADIPIVVVSGQEDVAIAVRLLKAAKNMEVFSWLVLVELGQILLLII